jgi:O-antigen ligase/tetratricopeptide (TPR) repeat protein
MSSERCSGSIEVSPAPGSGAEPFPARLARLALTAVAFVPLFAVPAVMFPGTVGRTALFRVLLGVAGLCTVLLVVLRAPVRTRGPGPVGWALAALIGWLLVAGALGAAPLRSVFGSLERSWGIVGWASMLLWLLLLRTCFRAADWDRFFGVSLIVGSVIAVYALLQLAGITVGWASTIAGGRPEGTLGNPGYLGIYTAMVAGVAVLQAVRADSATERAIALAVGALALAACVASGTRGALLGVGIGAVVGCLLATRWLPPTSRVRLAVGAALVGVFAAAALVVPQARSALEDVPALDRLTRVAPESGSWRVRAEAWRVAVEGLREDPWTGVGPENFQVLHHRHVRPEDYSGSGPGLQYDRAHNMPLQILATAGIPGGLIYLAFWGTLLALPFLVARREGASSARTAVLTGIFVAYFVFLQLWFEDVSSFLLLVAVAANAESRLDEGVWPTIGEGDRRGPPLLVGAGALAAGALLAAFVWYGAVVPARSTWLARQAERAETVELQVHRYRFALAGAGAFEGDLSHAYVDHVVGLTGWWRLRAPDEDGAELLRTALHTGLGSLDRVVSREPLGFRPRLDAYRLQRLAHGVLKRPGSLEEARRLLDRMLDLSPGRVSVHQQMAETYLAEGRPERAMVWLDRADSMAPGVGSTSEYRARVLWSQDRRADAETELFRAFGRGHVPAGPGFVMEVGGWLEETGASATAAKLYLTYLSVSYRSLHADDAPAPSSRRFYDVQDRRLAYHVPVALREGGRFHEAVTVARGLAVRTPAGSAFEERRRILREFADDVEAGRTERWLGAWSAAHLPTESPPGSGPPALEGEPR